MPEQLVPYIVVDFEVSADLVFVVIKNLSNRAALKLKIKPSVALKGLGGRKNIAALTVFKEISYLAPQKEIRVFVDSYSSFFEHQEKMLVKFSITYENEEGKVLRQHIEHNLAIYKDLIFFIQKK